MERSKVIEGMVNRIRKAIHPGKIILFGSQAREEAQPGSDFDLLIIAPSSLPRWRRTPSLYKRLAGLGDPKDIVRWTPREVEEWRNVKSHFINRALREGELLYEKPS